MLKIDDREQTIHIVTEKIVITGWCKNIDAENIAQVTLNVHDNKITQINAES